LQREYHRWWSKDLSRDMELLCFGHAGTRVLVFPTSQGRFFEYENNGMVGCVADRIESGQLQLYCVDSVDGESWYNKHAHPYWRVQRHMQYERYLVDDVLALMEKKNPTPRLIATGCSFGAFHAANFGFRHPDKITGIVTMGGAFDMKDFVEGWYGEDLYFNNPPDYLANCTDPWKYNHIRTVLASGTFVGRKMSVLPQSCATRAYGMNYTYGGITASTIGPFGSPWPGCTWSREDYCARPLMGRTSS
jgi:esterase/lipase superfamily enzyme